MKPNRSRLSSIIGNASGVIRSFASQYHYNISNKFCQIKLPSGYFFGVSAASADTADSFEAYKFLTTSSTPQDEPRRDAPSKPPPPNSYAPPEDVQASTFSSQEAQFADLHNRLQIMAHALDNTLLEVRKLAEKSEGRHQELARNAMSADRLNAMDQKIQNIENTVQLYQHQFTSLQKLLSESHRRLTVGLPEHMSESKIMR